MFKRPQYLCSFREAGFFNSSSSICLQAIPGRELCHLTSAAPLEHSARSKQSRSSDYLIERIPRQTEEGSSAEGTLRHGRSLTTRCVGREASTQWNKIVFSLELSFVLNYLLFGMEPAPKKPSCASVKKEPSGATRYSHGKRWVSFDRCRLYAVLSWATKRAPQCLSSFWHINAQVRSDSVHKGTSLLEGG